MLLYPGVDSLNHNPLTQNRWFSDDEKFGIIVEDGIKGGDEIWNPYGGKSNGECKLKAFEHNNAYIDNPKCFFHTAFAFQRTSAILSLSDFHLQSHHYLS